MSILNYQGYKSPKPLSCGFRSKSVWTFLEACRNDRYSHHRLIRRLRRDTAWIKMLNTKLRCFAQEHNFSRQFFCLKFLHVKTKWDKQLHHLTFVFFFVSYGQNQTLCSVEKCAYRARKKSKEKGAVSLWKTTRCDIMKVRDQISAQTSKKRGGGRRSNAAPHKKFMLARKYVRLAAQPRTWVAKNISPQHGHIMIWRSKHDPKCVRYTHVPVCY